MTRQAWAACVLVTSLCACNRGKIALGNDIEDAEDSDDIEELCDDYEDFIDDKTVEVLFEAYTGECPWDEGDNLSMSNGYLTARVEQSEDLGLDDEVVICDMALDLTGLVPGEVQLMVYDDYFFFTFNDVVLASSHGDGVAGLERDDGFPIYDWDDIVGIPFPSGDAPYCLGEASGKAECDIPSTEVQGPISLAYDDSIVDRLSIRALDEERFEFGFVTTGDNDPTTDCQHAEFGFTVDVEYLEP